VCVDAKCFKGGDEYEDGDPSVSEGEWEVNEDLVGPATGLVIPAQDPVDMGGGRIDEQTEDESPDVMTVSPKVDIDGDEDGEDGEPPTNTLNDESVTSVGELIDEITE